MTDPASQPNYQTSDFTAVNAYVDSVANIAFERARYGRATRFATYAKYSALVIVALGLLALLVLWGFSFLKEPQVVTETRIIEKPVALEPNIYIGNPAALDQTRSAAQRRVSEATAGSGVSAGVFDYVIFREIAVGETGLDNLTIGMRYANNEDPLPSEQWCYVERNTRNITKHRETIYLANKNGNEISMTSLSSQHARKLGISLETLKRAQSLCEFR